MKQFCSSVLQEIKKISFLPLAVTTALGIVLLCLCSSCFIDESAKAHSILSLLFADNKAEIIQNYNLVRSTFIINGMGQWFDLFVPSFVVLGYQYALSYERKKGAFRLLMVRESPFCYSVSKLLAVMIVSGLTVAISFLIYILMTFSVLKDCFGAVEDIQSFVLSSMGIKSVNTILIRYSVSAFLYGAYVCLPGYLAGIFFNDMYMLICVPMLVQYAYMTFISFLTAKLFEKGNTSFSEKINWFQFSNLKGGGLNKGFAYTILFGTLIAVFSCALFTKKISLCKRSGRYV